MPALSHYGLTLYWVEDTSSLFIKIDTCLSIHRHCSWTKKKLSPGKARPHRETGFCFHLLNAGIAQSLGIIPKKIKIQYVADAKKQSGVDIRTREYVIHISSVAIYLWGEPYRTATLTPQFIPDDYSYVKAYGFPVSPEVGCSLHIFNIMMLRHKAYPHAANIGYTKILQTGHNNMT